MRSGVRRFSLALVATFVLPAACTSVAWSLPDGRVYEQVSPVQKSGSQAGIRVTEVGGGKFADTPLYSVAVGVGEGAVVYGQSGPFGETSSGYEEYSVSRRTDSGWKTKAALPPGYGANATNIEGEALYSFFPSYDLSRSVFSTQGSFSAEATRVSALYASERTGDCSTSASLQCEGGVFRVDETDPREADAWLSEPVIPNAQDPEKPDPLPGNSRNLEQVVVAGGSADLSTVYFDFYGTLVPEDASRAPHVTGETGAPQGFYEWHEGAGLKSAGELPDGNYNPYGAVAANSLAKGGEPERVTTGTFGNQVSADGSKAFFVSPEPRYAGAAGEPAELYVREQSSNGPRTILVSRDELLPPVGTEPAPAPGMGRETAVTPMGISYSYGSPDGSRVFFQSMDKLAKGAEGAEPSGAGPYMYEFDLAAERLMYLPGIAGQVVASSKNGSNFLFVKTEEVEVYVERNEETLTWRLPTALDVYTNGQVREIASLPVPAEVEEEEELERLANVPMEARATADGSVFVFDTNSPLTSMLAPTGFNNANGYSQVYRYLAPAAGLPEGVLTCVSCPSAPTSPSGDASLSVDKASGHTQNSRAISSNGDKIFFTTPEALVQGDINARTDDVYEWENAGMGSCATGTSVGCLFLISSGTSPYASYYLDSDASGENVFFTTREGLVPSDTDESYDVYDARVNGGVPHEAASSPCVADCRISAPPPVQLSPLTTTIGPSGNLIPTVGLEPKPKPRTKLLTRAQKLAKALKVCSRKAKQKRPKCVRQARRKYGNGAVNRKKRRSQINNRRAK